MDGTGAVGQRLGRYVLYEAIAAGGMASVHFGRLVGPIGFARTVAIKRLHPHLARDPALVAMFIDEARLAARVHHPNVVSTLDVVTESGEVFLVLDYVKGESLAALMRGSIEDGKRIPIPVLASIVSETLRGLHAAHEATTDRGESLGLVHRDVSPQNILVGEDGVARLADFGIAKASARVQTTQDGQVKGKLAYMPPEQIEGGRVDRRVDVYAAGAVLWEGLTGQRLVGGDDARAIVAAVIACKHDAPSRHAPGVSSELDRLVLRALSSDPNDRFETAEAMASALEGVVQPASQGVVAAWVRARGGESLARRAVRLAEIEATPTGAVAHLAGDVAIAASTRTGLHRVAEAPTLTGQPGRAEEEPVVAPVPSPNRSRRWTLVIASAAIVASLLVAVGVTSRRASGAAPKVTPSPAIVPSAVVSAPPVVPTTSSAVATPPVPQAAPSARTVRKAPPRPATSSCDPPYTLDPSSKGPDGQPIKRFKVWCL